MAAGEHRLDPMLAAIADAALMLTGATGVALAMWKDGAMVCRARTGETAPPLGAQLSANTGISGLCLRTGKTQHCVDTEVDRLVDREVCRTLGLRSIAVLPIHGERGNNGILEAFSTEPKAFTSHHLAVLEHLAALAERARAAKPVGASPAAAPIVVRAPVEKPEHSGLLPASDRIVDFVHVLVGRRPLVLGALGLAVAALLGLMIWLGWRVLTVVINARQGQIARPDDQCQYPFNSRGRTDHHRPCPNMLCVQVAPYGDGRMSVWFRARFMSKRLFFGSGLCVCE